MSEDLLKEFSQSESRPLASDPDATFEDDFGDFEVADQSTEHIPYQANCPAALVNDTPSPTHANAGIEVFGQASVATGKAENQSYGQGRPGRTRAEQEDWGSFEDGTVLFDSEVESALNKASAQERDDHSIILPTVEADDHDFDAWEPTESSEGRSAVVTLQPLRIKSTAIPAKAVSVRQRNETGPPPSNVPPPSLLMNLGATVIQATAVSLRTPDEEHLLDAGDVSADLQAMGRILAGRKARWKRDNILSQSMNIGMAGKQGGMKLTKVDKTENRREDQEAGEILRVWRLHAGALRTFLASSGAPQMPELGESMPTRAEKAAAGAIIALKPCFLCGLKREERVQRLDFKVEDSFGEWWMEHWGHIACVKFWDRHRGSLPSR